MLIFLVASTTLASSVSAFESSSVVQHSNVAGHGTSHQIGVAQIRKLLPLSTISWTKKPRVTGVGGTQALPNEDIESMAAAMKEDRHASKAPPWEIEFSKLAKNYHNAVDAAEKNKAAEIKAIREKYEKVDTTATHRAF